MDRIKNYLAKQNELGLIFPSLNETSPSPYERYSKLKMEEFKRNLIQEIKESVKPRIKAEVLKNSIDKLIIEPTAFDAESALKKRKKSLKGNHKEKLKSERRLSKKVASGSTQVSSEDGQTSSIPNELQEDEIQFSVFGLPEDEARAVLWKHIARKQIPKLSRSIHQGTTARLFNCKKIAQAAAGLVKRQNSRLAGKPVIAARRAMKEMLAFWKRNEREERELRKRAEKEAIERRKIEEEQREARRQAKKLNFLITQTELYSHFVGRKQQQGAALPASAQSVLSMDTDFADVDDSVIHAEAERIAKNAAAAHQAKLEQFQTSALASEGNDMDFMNPSTLKDAIILEQPTLMQVALKSYQLKGLTWLASLYEQVII